MEINFFTDKEDVMAPKNSSYVIEGYSKLYSDWIFICFVHEDSACDTIDVSDFDEIRVRLNNEKTVTVKFQRGEGARPLSNRTFDENKPIFKRKVLKEEVFIKKGKPYYRMVCGHGDYVDLLVEE